MRHRGFEPRTTWLKVKCSTNWANIPYAQNRNRTSDTRIFSPLLYQLSYLGILDLNFHSDLSSGDRIWTYDLRVMSPTSFQTAPSRDKCYLLKRRMGRGGFEPPKQVAADLQSVPFGHSGICPFITKQYKIDLLHSSITWIVKADDRTRTDNLLITNQLLCQLSHIGIYHQLICNQLLCLQLTRFSSIVEKWVTSA